MIYAQHGYGKADKIETGIREGLLTGVILGPRNEQPDKMVQFANALRQEFQNQITILFDPQFYIANIAHPNPGPLADYTYYRAGLSRGSFVSPTDVHRYADEALTYQTGLPLDRLVSPTVLFSDFRDPWSQISLLLAQESITVHSTLPDPPPLLVSLTFDEAALRNRDAMDEFLNIISLWDIAGFYVLVRQNDPTYPAQFEESTLASLIYLVYTLSERNDFEVVCGYADLVALPLHAVGASATGVGWFNTLRQFSLSRFQPPSGGQPARMRYTSRPLINSILVVPELQTAYQLGLMDEVLSGTARDGVFATGSPANAQWPNSASYLHHWEVVSGIAGEIASQGTVSDRLTYLEGQMQGALGQYAVLDDAGVPFEAATGPRNLTLGLRAIRSFRADVRI